MSINLLPWREQQKIMRRQKLIVLLVLTTLASILLCAFLNSFFLFRIQITHQNTQTINRKIANIPMQSIQDHKILLKKLVWLSNEKTKSSQFNARIQRFLTLIANDLPPSITLRSLTMSDKKNTLSGEGDRLDEIHLYAQTLQKEFNNTVTLSDIHNESNDNATFYFIIQVAA